MAKTLKELQSEYDSLAQKAQTFDLETVKLIKSRENETKAIVAKRKSDKAAIMASKLAAFNALHAAKEEAAKPAPKVLTVPSVAPITATSNKK